MTAPMKISDAGLKMLKGFEGFRQNAYQDIVGVWTIGYGETQLDGRPVRSGDVLPEPAAAERLRARCDGHFGAGVATATTGVALTQHQYDACVSLTYNIGTVGFAKSSVARCLRAGNISGASAAFLMWNKAGGIVRPVLVRRRAAERACFDTGVYPR